MRGLAVFRDGGFLVCPILCANANDKLNFILPGMQARAARLGFGYKIPYLEVCGRTS